MRRALFRRAYVLMLGFLVALGMGLAAVQASNMAVAMTVSGQHMSASSMGHCGSCKDSSSATKAIACVAPVNAMVPQFATLLIQRSAERPLSQSPVLSGWMASPNPHPPKHIALI